MPKENTITQRSSPSQRPRTLRLIKTVLVKSGLIFSKSAPSPTQTPSNVGVTHILPNMHILIPLRHALLRLELIHLQQQLQENLQHIATDRSARAGVHAVPEIERLARGGSPFVLSRGPTRSVEAEPLPFAGSVQGRVVQVCGDDGDFEDCAFGEHDPVGQREGFVDFLR
jgi:hypothetical protein